MSKMIFINLPVRDLDASIAFFSQLGFEFNGDFTDETATCMIVNEQACVMLLTQEKFSTFSPNPICDASAQTEVLIALSCESRDEVEAMVRDAVAAGGQTYSEPQDHGFMVQHGFQDLDGHIWELVYMDPAAMPAG